MSLGSDFPFCLAYMDHVIRYISVHRRILISSGFVWYWRVICSAFGGIRMWTKEQKTPPIDMVNVGT